MGKIAKSLWVAGAIGAVIGASSTHAMMNFEELGAYVGADYEWSYMRGAKSSQLTMFGRAQALDRFYPKSYSSANVYVGGRWCDWGLEVGYDVSGRKSRNQQLRVIDLLNPYPSAFNQFNTFSSNAFDVLGFGDRLITRVKLSGWHLDLNGYMPLCDCWELIGSIGLGWLKPKISITGEHRPANVPTSGVVRESLNVSNKYRGMLRLGLGTQYMVTECIGFRGMIRWKNTEKLRVQITNAEATVSPAIRNVSFRPFRDTVSLAIGAFVKF